MNSGKRSKYSESLQKRLQSVETQKARQLATQLFLERDPSNAVPLTKDSLRRCFPGLFRIGMPSGYYVRNANATPVIGLILVDVRFKPVVRICERCKRVLEEHQSNPTFFQLLRKRQFELTVLVATSHKQKSLAIAFRRQGRWESSVQVTVVPELLNLLCPLSNNTPRR